MTTKSDATYPDLEDINIDKTAQISRHELFKLCLSKYDEFMEKGEHKKWYYQAGNRFALVNLEKDNFDPYKIHIIDYKTIYSFIINRPEHEIRYYLDGYRPEENIQITLRQNNNAIKCSGIIGMSIFVSTYNLHRLPVIANYHSVRDNYPFWKTLFAKY